MEELPQDIVEVIVSLLNIPTIFRWFSLASSALHATFVKSATGAEFLLKAFKSGPFDTDFLTHPPIFVKDEHPAVTLLHLFLLQKDAPPNLVPHSPVYHSSGWRLFCNGDLEFWADSATPGVDPYTAWLVEIPLQYRVRF